jgi:CRISPR-associated protein Cmr2
MYKDFTAHLVGQFKEVFESLTEAESRAVAARRLRDMNARKDAERDAEGMRRELSSRIPAVAVNFLEATGSADADGVRAAWQRQTAARPGAPWYSVVDVWRLEDFFNLFALPQVPLLDMPQLSFHVSLTFALEKAYVSRDDDPFYVLDNPVRKDKIFRLPGVAPSAYKGAFRSAARGVLGDTPEEGPDGTLVERLFGTDRRRETEELHAGRLQFFPTFFKNVGLEVINPHLRESGAGDRPIFMETATGSGEFNLFYLPIGLSPEPYAEVAEDLRSVARLVRAAFTESGFGAKTGNGFGVTKEQLVGVGRIRMKAIGLQDVRPVEAEAPPAQRTVELPGYLKAPGILKDEFVDEHGRLLAEDKYQARLRSTGREYNKKSRQLFEKAKGWWEREQRKLQQEETAQPAEGLLPEAAAIPPIHELTFGSFGELIRAADTLSQALSRMGGQAW